MKLVTIMLMAGVAALAQPPAPPSDVIKAYLTLTDSQVTSLATIRQNEMTAGRSLQQEIATKDKALRDAVNAGSTDAASLGQQLIDIAALRKKVDQIHTDAQAQAVAVLTDAQKTKLQTLIDASKLQQTIQQAVGLDLISPPEGAGPGGPGGPGARGVGGPGPGGAARPGALGRRGGPVL